MIGCTASTNTRMPAISATTPKNVADTTTQPSALMAKRIKNAAKNNVDRAMVVLLFSYVQYTLSKTTNCSNPDKADYDLIPEPLQYDERSYNYQPQ